jgi:uncharacterized protein YdbL (DUF1318 family)
VGWGCNFMKNKNMNFKVLITLIISMFSMPVIAVDKFDQLSWVGKFIGEEIVINNPYGNVRMRYGGENNAIEYIAIIQNLEKNVHLSVNIDTKESNKIIFTVVDDINKEEIHGIKSRLDITFFIPKNKNLYVETIGGLIEAKGLIANINAISTNGNIVLNKIKGYLNSINNAGKTDITITQIKEKSTQSFISQTGDVNVWVNRKANYLIEVSTSSDIISDFSMKIENFYNQEPNKKGLIKLNKKKSKIIIKSKRGRTAIRGFGKYLK